MLFKCATVLNQTRSQIHIYIRDKDERLKVWSKIAQSRKARTAQITSRPIDNHKGSKDFFYKGLSI